MFFLFKKRKRGVLFLFIISLLIISDFVIAQNKHALVIAVSDYPQLKDREKNWAVLSSNNDVELVMEMLKRQQFDQKNTHTLLDKEVTVPNIESAFEQLIKNVQQGDIVYFQFSGHGQQVEDVTPDKAPKLKHIGKDEKDGYDEALVTYNAPIVFYPGYQFQEHFLDDEMHYYMNLLRKKLGGKGQVIAVFDCCHSGSATRGADDYVVRGTSIQCASPGYEPNLTQSDSSLAFDADFDYDNRDDMAKLTAFFGCKAEQQVREIRDPVTKKGYGSLTYFFMKALEQLGPNASYNNLFTKINEQMIIRFQNAQQPEIEGDNLNQLIFNGQFIDQKPYFTITDASLDKVTINGGSLHGLAVGDSVGLFSNLALSSKGEASMNTGVIIEEDNYTAKVQLNKPLDVIKSAGVKYRAFRIYSSSPAITLKLKLQVKSKSLKKELEKIFSNEKAIQIVEKDFEYLITDTMYQGNTSCVMVYLGPGKNQPLRSMTPRVVTGNSEQSDSLVLFIKQSMKTDLFRKLELQDDELSFDYKLIPCGFGGECKIDSNQAIMGNQRFMAGEKFQLQIKNTSHQRIFINIMDIDPTNVLAWGNPSTRKLRNVELLMNEQKAFTIKINPPYGVEQMKLIATDRPVDFSSLQEYGSSLTRGAESNPLLDFVDHSVNGTRGAEGSDPGGATIKTMTFEIMQKK